MDNNINLEGRLYVAGTRGYSNYEIAVQNGFEGTEEEWLQTIYNYAAEITTNAIVARINAGSFGIQFQTTYYSTNEELILDLEVVNIEEV